MQFRDLRRNITESYIDSIGRDGWTQVYAHFDKLHGRMDEDLPRIDAMRRLSEEDDFDPFGHMVDIGDIDEKKDCVLSFARGNDKLQQLDVVYLALPAGYACPFADACMTMAHRKGKEFPGTGMKIKQMGDVRCYAASQEAQYKQTRERNWRNYDLLRKYGNDVEGMRDLIIRSLRYYEDNNPNIRIFRIHESGDFFSQAYFDAWIEAAQLRSDILFYAYTKSLPYWEARKDEIPKNLRLIASEGGKRDDLIDKNQFRQAIIVKDQGEAIKRRLRIDVNDFLAAFGDEDFALLVHGTQQRGTDLGKDSYANAKILRAAKKLRSDPQEIEKLFRYYTDVR